MRWIESARSDREPPLSAHTAGRAPESTPVDEGGRQGRVAREVEVCVAREHVVDEIALLRLFATAVLDLVAAVGGGVTGDPAGKRLPIGNLVNRVIGVAVALALLNWIGPKLVTLDPDPARAVADFHTGFNIVMALLFFPKQRRPRPEPASPVW